MTADELLHKYFDVLAVEQLQSQTCVLLNEFREQVLNSDKKEMHVAIGAINKLDNSQLEKLTLLWTQFFFEARSADDISKFDEKDRIPTFAESIIHELLWALYGQWVKYKKPSEAMILALLEAPKPVFYARYAIFHGFLLMVENVKISQNFSEPVFRQLKKFDEKYQQINAQISFANKDKFAPLEIRLHALVVQYELIQKYFGHNPNEQTLQPTTYALLNNLSQEVINNDKNRPALPFLELQAVQDLLALDEAEFQTLTVHWTRFFIEAALTRAKDYIYMGGKIIDNLLIALYRNEKTAKESIVVAILAVFNPKPLFYNDTIVVTKYFVALLERVHKKNALSATTVGAITDFYTQYKALKEGRRDEQEHLQLQARLSTLITAPDVALPFDHKVGCRFYEVGEDSIYSAQWPSQIIFDIETMSSDQKKAWGQLWVYAATAGSSPTKKWLTQGQSLVQATESFVVKAKDWLEIVLQDVEHNETELSDAFSDVNKQAIKGFIWLCSLADSEELATVLAGLVNFGYSKAYGVGARAPAVANAALYTLGLVGAQGVVQLSKLRSKVKFKAGLKIIEKSLAEAAARQGISQDDLE